MVENKARRSDLHEIIANQYLVIMDLENQLDDDDRLWEEFKKERESLVDGLVFTSDENRNLSEERAKLLLDISSLMEDNTLLQQTIVGLKSVIPGEKEAALVKLRDKAEEKIQELIKENSGLRLKVESLKAEIVDKDEEIVDLQDHVDYFTDEALGVTDEEDLSGVGILRQ